MNSNEQPNISQTPTADSLRKELETFPKLQGDLEEWTNEEKERFLTWCRRFNNFWRTVEATFNKEPGEDEGEFDGTTPIKIANEYTDEEVAQMIRDSEGSEKYYNSSYDQFEKDIKRAFTESGADIEDVDECTKRMDEFYVMSCDATQHNKFKKGDPEFDIALYTKRLDTSVRFYRSALPAILKLLDSGYIIRDLSK